MKESLKPIEPGCLALMLPYPGHETAELEPGSPRPGDVVRVVRPWTLYGHGFWIVSEEPLTIAVQTVLMRIDPDDDQREEFRKADEFEENLRRIYESAVKTFGAFA